ncbi:MAG: LPXTG cell wall anchor domain-containing protein [Bacteroidales bacterium]|jgi:LPXTG-motif cell wall-anchored protein|nr:LPXTG cell wall anchor domain-containing protein [Bacteroidales bacterium]
MQKAVFYLLTAVAFIAAIPARVMAQDDLFTNPADTISADLEAPTFYGAGGEGGGSITYIIAAVAVIVIAVAVFFLLRKKKK